jgi:biotin operon repressor
VSPTAFKLLLWLDRQFPDGGVTNASSQTIALELECSSRAVRRAVAQLRQAGFVKVERAPVYDRAGAGYRLLRYVA